MILERKAGTIILRSGVKNIDIIVGVMPIRAKNRKGAAEAGAQAITTAVEQLKLRQIHWHGVIYGGIVLYPSITGQANRIFLFSPFLAPK